MDELTKAIRRAEEHKDHLITRHGLQTIPEMMQERILYSEWDKAQKINSKQSEVVEKIFCQYTKLKAIGIDISLLEKFVNDIMADDERAVDLVKHIAQEAIHDSKWDKLIEEHYGRFPNKVYSATETLKTEENT